MGYTREYLTKPQTKKRPWEVHPVWRGIGCLLLIVVPITSYLGASVLVEMNSSAGWVPAPAAFMRAVTLPVLEITLPHLFANLVTAGILIVLGYAVLMIGYTFLYSWIGPPSLGPLDAEPVRRSPKQKYKIRR